MAASIPQARQQGLKILQQLSRTQQVMVGLVALGTIALIFGYASFGQRADMATLYSNLSESDAGAVIAKLKEDKVPYELADNGKSVRVPAQNVYETRLQLANAGLPQGGVVGFELFDKTNFGITDFAQKLNYQRALEGELTRTINRLDSVDQARVHIVLPQAELYTEKDKDATASVVLKLKSGRKLDAKQVQGIGHLVSSSVEGLKSQNVTILDTNGTVLSESAGISGASSSIQVSGSQLEMQRAYETNVEKSIITMLDRAVGPGKAAIKVNAVLDWDTNESVSETYGQDGKPALLRSSQEIEERYGGPTSGTGGTPGSGANLPGTPGYGQVISGTNMAYERKEATKNYEMSKLVEKVNKAPGGVKRLSVAVILDETLDDAQVQTVTSAVSAAAGISQQRGDTIAVSRLPFDRTYYTEQQRDMESAQQQEFYLNIGKLVAVALASLLVLIIFRSLIKTISSPMKNPVTSAAGAGVPETRASVSRTVSPEPVRRPIEARPSSPRNPEDAQKEAVRQQVQALVRSKPDRIARMIQTWLKED